MAVRKLSREFFRKISLRHFFYRQGGVPCLKIKCGKYKQHGPSTVAVLINAHSNLIFADWLFIIFLDATAKTVEGSVRKTATTAKATTTTMTAYFGTCGLNSTAL